jgi:hypothetical protein
MHEHCSCVGGPSVGIWGKRGLRTGLLQGGVAYRLGSSIIKAAFPPKKGKRGLSGGPVPAGATPISGGRLARWPPRRCSLGFSTVRRRLPVSRVSVSGPLSVTAAASGTAARRMHGPLTEWQPQTTSPPNTARIFRPGSRLGGSRLGVLSPRRAVLRPCDDSESPRPAGRAGRHSGWHIEATESTTSSKLQGTCQWPPRPIRE